MKRYNRSIQSTVLSFSLASLLSCSFPISAWAMAKKPPVPAPQEVISSAANIIAEPPPPPLSLDDCFSLTVQQSEYLAIKGVDVEKTWADFLKASSVAIGEGHFYMTDFRQEVQKNSVDSTNAVAGSMTRDTQHERFFNIKQPLFQGFKAFGAVTGAGSLRAQRIFERKRAAQTLFLETANSFYTVLRLKRDIQITGNIIVLLRQRIQELMKREAVGRSRLSEVVNARATLKSMEATRAKKQGDWIIERRLLEFFTGISLEDRKLLDDTPIPRNPGNMEDYLKFIETRPDVQAAKESVNVYLQSLVIAQSNLWPNITMEHNHYERREGFESGIDWDLLFTFDIPLFKGGATLAAIKESYSNWKKAKLEYAQLKRKAELEIKQAYNAWAAQLERYKYLQEAVRESKKNYQLQTDEYKRSLVSNLDVLAALQLLNQNLLEANITYYDLKKSYQNLRVATGDCCESI